jgi:signal transduction histidine kinase
VVAVLATVTTGYMFFLLTRLPVWDFGSWLVALTLLTFAVAATFAGTRMVGLASRTAAEAYGAGLARRHGEELAAANAALQEARDKAELLGRLIVHDLRSPVATITLGLGVLGEALGRLQPPPAEALDALEMSRAEARRLGDMLGDLLAVSRLEEGVRARRVPVEVPPLVAACARGVEAQASREGVSLTSRVPDGLVAPLDAPLVRRMLENLAGNALRHVGAGDRIEISAEGAGGSLRLAVRNSGPPVPEEVRGRLFEKHVSGEARSWRHQGLGLHFCRLAAEAHGGTIALVDRAGWSVSFEAELPLD